MHIHEGFEIHRQIGFSIAMTKAMKVVVGSKLHFSTIPNILFPTTAATIPPPYDKHHTRTVLIHIILGYTRHRTSITPPHVTAVGFVRLKRICIPTARVLREIEEYIECRKLWLD